MGRSTPTTAFDGRHCRHNTDILDIYMKKFDYQKVYFLENGSCVNLDKFIGLHLHGVCLCYLVLTWTDQLLPQLLMD